MAARNIMQPAFVVEIETPKKYLLNGLWFGPSRPKRIVILVHALTGSLFSMRRVVDTIVDRETAVLTFNNRGFEQISEYKRVRGKKSEWKRGGAGHEIFTECEDDIEGAVRFARKMGVKHIFLAGHSTGCQKAVYWANKHQGGKAVQGIILFGPLSDYAIALEHDRGGKLARSVAYAKRLIREGKPHALMPTELGPWFACDAQRFVSLYTSESAEELFPYAQPKKKPAALRSLRTPVLVFLAGSEEYTKRPAKELAAWFTANIRSPHQIAIVPRVGHGFKGGEKRVVTLLRRFMKETRS